MSILTVLSFLAGIVSLLAFHHLPAVWLVTLVAVIVLSFCFFIRHSVFFLLILCFVFGFCWAYAWANVYFSPTLPSIFENTPLILTGEVVDFPVVDTNGSHFVMAVQSLTTLDKRVLFTHGQVRLQAKNGRFKLGAHYRCLVNISHHRGLFNPGGEDTDAFALANNVRWRGRVMKADLIDDAFNWRQRLQAKLIPLLPHSTHASWLMALILGDRSAVPQADWETLRNTGTNHLMAVGGLHLGMVAAWAAGLVGWWWRRSTRLLLLLPLPWAVAAAATLFSFFYAALAGFSIATLRAFTMILALTLILLLRRQCPPWQSLALALGFALLIHPFMVFMPAAWLSFTAIALIIYATAGRPFLKKSHHGLRLQMVLGLGLFPLSLYCFQSSAFISGVANVIAIPWLMFLILPFCLLATITVFFLPTLAKALLSLAGQSLSLLWIFLEKLAQLPGLEVHHAMTSVGILGLMMFFMLLALSPRGTTGRLCGVLVLPLLYFTAPPPLPKGDFKLTVLDVGQGLSVVGQTRHHVFVYDAGGRLSASDDQGERVVLPYLRTIDAKQLDALIVSHGDNDHAGGVPALLKAFRVRHVYTSVPEKFEQAHPLRCEEGMHWRWDDVDFKMMAPTQQTVFTGNNASCVLLVDNGRVAALLPGDIEADAEAALLASHQTLKATVLIAPHHGSDTSSTPAFIQAVSPNTVVYSTGYHNHYHLPNHHTVLRYQQAGVMSLNTVNAGAITFTFGQTLMPPDRYRKQAARFWNEEA